MRLLLAFLRHELRVQGRSLRFRFVATLYVVASIAAPVTLLVALRQVPSDIVGPATFARLADLVLPGLTALLAMTLAVDGLTRERDERAFVVLALAPITSIGYVARRYVALSALTLAMSLVGPAVTLACAASATDGPIPWRSVAWPWLLRVVPAALGGVAVALGMGTIVGHPVLGLVVGLLGYGAALEVGTWLLALVGRGLTPPHEILASVIRSIPIGIVVSGAGLRGQHVVVSEVPLDAHLLAQRALQDASLSLPLALGILAASAAYLRRARPDIRPWTIRPDHPIRTYLKWIARAREGAYPDPGLTWREGAAIGLAMVSLVAAIRWTFERQDRFHSLAQERAQVDVLPRPEPTPVGVVPGAWSVTGRLRASGRLEVTVQAEMVARVVQPVSRLAFSLDEHLAVTSVRANEGAAAARRLFDRLSVELDPPLPPGGRRTLTFTIAGTPRSVDLALPGRGGFSERWSRFERARVKSDMSDLSRSLTTRLATRQRTNLAGATLVPVPRYAPWGLTPRPTRETDPPQQVRPETVFPSADVRLDLDVPDGMFLADTCGDVVRPRDPAPRLQGACRTPLSELWIAGGAQVVLPDVSEDMIVAVLPAHASFVRDRADTLAAAADLAERLWPGTAALAGSVVLELPPMPTEEFQELNWPEYMEGQDIVAAGRVLGVSEAVLLRRFEPGRLAARAVAADLMSRRTHVASQEAFFRAFYRRYVWALAGGSPASGAVGGGSSWLDRPLFGPDASWWGLETKLARLLVDLEHRVGAPALRQGIEDFVTSPSAEPATAKELLDAIAERARVSLDAFHADYVAGGRRPVLTLEDVEFRRDAMTFVVTGKVVNLGTGEAWCPLVVRTDLEPATVTVTVPSEGATPFAIGTPARPRTLLLDPDNRCFRTERRNTLLRVENVEAR